MREKMMAQKEEVGKDVHCVVRIYEGAQHRGRGAKDRGEKERFKEIRR
jgi:hypothetical protein